MALTQDQIFMLANLADWAGSKMAPDNPFAGYTMQYVQARNFAKLLQQAGQQPKPEEKPEEEKPEEKTSALAPPNPFSLGDWSPNRGYLPDISRPPGVRSSVPEPGGIGDYTGDRGYLPDITPPSDLMKAALTKGVEAKFDADNNLTLTRKVPATTHAETAPKPPTNMATASVYNPFLWRG